MKYGGSGKRSQLHRSQKAAPVAQAGPSLREFWDELQRAKAAGEPLPLLPSSALDAHAAAPRFDASASAARRPDAALSSGAFLSSAAFLSSGSGGSGSGVLGYGLGLIDPDPESTDRIQMILQLLCARDEERRRYEQRIR